MRTLRSTSAPGLGGILAGVVGLGVVGLGALACGGPPAATGLGGGTAAVARGPAPLPAASSTRGGPPPAIPPGAPTTSAPAPPPEASSVAPGASSGLPAVGAPPAASLPRGTKVLHVGDSFAGALGQELNRELAARGVQGVLRFKTASFIPEWAWKPDLGVLMAEHRPDLVIVTLGANEVQIGDPSSRAATVERLVRRLGDTPCLWIGIPLWKAGDTGLLPVIRDHCAPCRYLDSDALIRDMPRLDDHIHPTMAARRRWAAWLVDWLAAARDPGGAQPWALLPQERLPREPRLEFGPAPAP